MVLVAGVDSSTQSCKVVVRDASTGALVRDGRAPHPTATEVHPDRWWHALCEAGDAAGGFDDVAAVSVAGQQHGLVCLDDAGEVVRPALLWNDTRSAGAADDLVRELGADTWAEAVGSVPLAAFTVAKLRWLADHEPDAADRVAAVCLPHDWLTWKLSGSTDLADLVTDRGDASGTGYWSPTTGAYRQDLVAHAFGRELHVPRVLDPAAGESCLPTGARLGAGTGDNMAAALGVGAVPGDVIVSIGTSGVVSAVSEVATNDTDGVVAGFADATGRYLPLICTLNGAGVLDAMARVLHVDLDRLSALALEAAPGAAGIVLVPYLGGERTPNRPFATGALHGIRYDNFDPANVARAAVEGLLCGLADGMAALEAEGVEPVRVVLVGGGARSGALCRIAPTVLGRPVLVPPPGEYVADGAARQAAWVLTGGPEPPEWPQPDQSTFTGGHQPVVAEQYASVVELVAQREPEPSSDAPGMRRSGDG